MEEVGRVSIRVVPDFTHFRKHMNRVLNQYDNRKLNWIVDVDTAGIDKLKGDFNNLARDAKAAGKGLTRELTRSVKAAAKSAGKEAEITPTVTNAARYKRRIQSDFNKLMNDLEVRLNFKGGDNQALRQYWDKEAASFQKSINKITPDMDIRLFSAQAAWLNATMKKLREESGNVWDSPAIRKGILDSRSEIDKLRRESRTALAYMFATEAKAAAANERLGQAFDKAFKIQTRQALREYIYGFRDLDGTVNRLSSRTDKIRMRGGIIGSMFGGALAIAGAKEALGLVGAAGKGVASLGSTLAKFTPSFGTGLNLAAYALIAALITPVLALLSGLIVAAPAGLAAVAIPIAAIALGLDGIKKAAETAKPAFEQMRKDISAVFEKGMIPGFTDVRDTILPGLTESFKGVAGSLSNLFNEFTANLSTQTNMDNMNNIIKNTGVAAQQAIPGVKNFTNGLLELVSKLSNKFPGLSDAFNRTAESFVGWVERITKVDTTGTSQLDRAMTTLGTTLSDLGGIISDLFASGFDNLGNASFGESMKSFVQDIRSLVSEVLPALAQSFQGIATALRPITALVESTSKGVEFFNNATRIENFAGTGVPEPDWNGLEKLQFSFDAIFNKDKAKQKVMEYWLSIGEAQAAGATAAIPAANKAALEYSNQIYTALATDKEKQKELIRSALTGQDLSQATAAQITSQATVAITGAQQALIPLKQGLQTDIDAALQPLGDISGRIVTAFQGTGDVVSGALSQIPGIVTSSLAPVKSAAETSLNGINEAVVAACAMALLTAQTQAPAIIQPFKDLGGQMEGVGRDMMGGLAIGIANSAEVAKTAAATAAADVLAAAKAAVGSRSPSKDFMKLGGDLNAGLGIGINNSVAGPIGAIREVMQAIKDVFGSAEGLNLNFFMGQAATSMSSMATSSKEFRSNMVEAGTSPAITSGLDATELENVKRDKAAIDLQIATLQAQKNATQDKAAKSALTAEIDQLRIQKERLDLLKEESGLQEDRKTAIQQLSDTIATNITDMIKMPGDFAKATVSAAAQDLGISGSGAIPTIANWALDAGTNYIFNVNNMDDALQGQQAQQRSAALGVTG